jgi:hypothetical protein
MKKLKITAIAVGALAAAGVIARVCVLARKRSVKYGSY